MTVSRHAGTLEGESVFPAQKPVFPVFVQFLGRSGIRYDHHAKNRRNPWKNHLKPS